MTHRRIAGLLAGTSLLFSAGTAQAAPVTVDLRIEGPTRTLFEGPVTTDVRTFKFTDSSQEAECDGNGPTPQPTRNGALATAAEQTPFSTSGTLFAFGPSFDEIAGESVAYDPDTGKFLAEYKNGRFAPVGGCDDAVVNGDDVLYAYGDGSETLLGLSSSQTTVAPGSDLTVTVADLGTGQPVPGASVGGQTTGPDGRTTLVANGRGPQSLKATKAGAIRSNRLDICVTDGSDGLCGTVVPSPPAPAVAPLPPVPAAKITSVREGARYTRATAPRVLEGTVVPGTAGLREVRLRLSRTDEGRCSRFDGAAERFVRTSRCGVKNARTFSVGTDADWDYQLPSSLPRGRYVLDVLAYDRNGGRDLTYERGGNRVVFLVG